MGARRRFLPMVRGNCGYGSDACVWHVASCAIGAGRRRIGVLSSVLDHLVAVSTRAQTWPRQCKHCCRDGARSGVRHTRWRDCDEPIWLAPGFSRGGHGEPVMATAVVCLDAKWTEG